MTFLEGEFSHQCMPVYHQICYKNHQAALAKCRYTSYNKYSIVCVLCVWDSSHGYDFCTLTRKCIYSVHISEGECVMRPDAKIFSLKAYTWKTTGCIFLVVNMGVATTEKEFGIRHSFRKSINE